MQYRQLSAIAGNRSSGQVTVIRQWRIRPVAVNLSIWSQPVREANLPIPTQSPPPGEAPGTHGSGTDLSWVDAARWNERKQERDPPVVEVVRRREYRSDPKEGFIITGAGATAASVVTVTVTGTITGTLSFALVIPAGATTSITPLIVEFSRPIPASAANTAIVVNVPSFGAGNTNAAVVAHGFQL